MEVARRCSNLQTLNLQLQQHHRRQRVGSSKTMFESPNTRPRSCSNITDASVMEVARRCSNLQTLNLRLREHHRRQCVGSSKTMFESPNTQPLRLQEHH